MKSLVTRIGIARCSSEGRTANEPGPNLERERDGVEVEVEVEPEIELGTVCAARPIRT